jgi:hypothetical protein
MKLVGGGWCSGGAGGLGDPFVRVVVGFLGVPVVGGLVLWLQPMVRVCSARIAVRVIEVGPEVVRNLLGAHRGTMCGQDDAIYGRGGGCKAVVVCLSGVSCSSGSGLIHRLSPEAGGGLGLRAFTWLGHKFGKGGEGVPLEVVANGPEVGVFVGMNGAREA